MSIWLKSNRHKLTKEEIRQAASRAEGTLQGEQFLKLCTDRLEILLRVASRGVRPYTRIIDQTVSVVDKNILGVEFPLRVRTVEDSWKYFKAAVYENGALENRHIWCSSPGDQDLDYPAYNGLVLVIESRAEWVEKALCQWLEEKGLQRTIYVKVIAQEISCYCQPYMVSFPMPDTLAFALPMHNRS